jgi:hypothetical protein
MANKNVCKKREKWLSSILNTLIEVKDLLPSESVEQTISFNDNFSKENSDLIDVYLTKPEGTWGEKFLQSSIVPQLFSTPEDVVSFLKKKKEEGNTIALHYIFLQIIKDVNSLSPNDLVRFATEAKENPETFPFSPFYLGIPNRIYYVIRACISP